MPRALRLTLVCCPLFSLTRSQESLIILREDIAGQLTVLSFVSLAGLDQNNRHRDTFNTLLAPLLFRQRFYSTLHTDPPAEADAKSNSKFRMSSPGFVALDTSTPNAAALAMSAADSLADMILGLLWVGVLYVFGMIWTTLALIDRWRGPHGDGEINFLAVIAAFMLAVPWPAVLLIMALF